MAKNDECSIQQDVEVKLSGVICVPHISLNSDALNKWILSSFRETRFQNVLQRARVLPQTSWFWHHLNHTQLSEAAIAILASNTNDYKQILIKQNQLAQAVQELNPQADLLLLISSDQNFVFGTVLSNLESFSTHILFRQKKEQNSLGWGIKEAANSNSVEKLAVTNNHRRSLTGGSIR